MAYYLSIKVYNRALSSGSIISLLETTEKTKKNMQYFLYTVYRLVVAQIQKWFVDFRRMIVIFNLKNSNKT